MKRSDISLFLCPKCRAPLNLIEAGSDSTTDDQDQIVTGSLECSACQRRYPIVCGIPRFVDCRNYAASFGYQWKAFAGTQVGEAQKKISKIRFDCTTKWPDRLEGEKVIEAGCGAGRFSEIALDTGAEVYSFDLSEAVEAANDNIRATHLRRRHHVFQASIYEIPLPYATFDRIFCLGVLQHCPDVKAAFLSLIPLLKLGGEIVVDCYLSQPLKHAFNLKYLLRPFFKWWKPSWLFTFWLAVISTAYDLKLLVSRIPLIGSALGAAIPIGRLNYEPTFHFSVPELKEIKALSVIDMLSPKYDKCQRIDDVRAWMEEGGLEILDLTTGYNGINARGRRRIGLKAEERRQDLEAMRALS